MAAKLDGAARAGWTPHIATGILQRAIYRVRLYEENFFNTDVLKDWIIHELLGYYNLICATMSK